MANKGVMNTLRSIFGSQDNTEKIDDTTTISGIRDVGNGFSVNVYGYALDQAQQNRINYYKQADRLLKDDKASRACEVYADFIVTPTDNSKMEVDIQNNPKAKKIVDELNSRINMEEMAWEFGHDLSSYGDGFYEVVVAKDKKTIVGLSKLSEKSVKKNLTQQGFFQDFVNSAYIQIDPSTNKPLAEFAGWQILHMNAANRMTNVYLPTYSYGFQRSILYTALQRFIQHTNADKAAYVSRLFFGMLRIIEYVDTGSLDINDARALIRNLSEEFKQSVISDSKTGKVDLETFFNNNFYKREFIPRSETLKNSNVEILNTRVASSMEDVRYFRDEYITSLRVPKYLLGYTEDVATRANGLSFTADFAKSCARYQACIKAALIPFYRNALAMHGIHYTNYDINITFPIMGTVDNLMKHQIIALQSTIMKTLAVEVKLPMDVVLKDFLHIDEAKVKAIMDGIGEYVPPESQGSGQSAMAAAREILAYSMQANETLGYLVEDIKELSNYYEK